MFKKETYTLAEVAKRYSSTEIEIIALAISGSINIFFNWVANNDQVYFHLRDPAEPGERFTAGADDYQSMLARVPILHLSKIAASGKATIYRKLTNCTVEGLELIAESMICDSEHISFTIKSYDLLIKHESLEQLDSEYAATVEPSSDISNKILIDEHANESKGALRVIGALLDYIKGGLNGNREITQSQLINFIESRYGEDYKGLSPSLVKKLFASGNREFESSRQK
jgi:hypothetical protein